MALSKNADSTVSVVFNEEDLPFEEELLRNPHSLKAWLRYIEARSNSPKSIINLIYERALKVRRPKRNSVKILIKHLIILTNPLLYINY